MNNLFINVAQGLIALVCCVSVLFVYPGDE